MPSQFEIELSDERFPDEIWLSIFSFFSYKQLAHIRSVNKRFLKLSYNEQLLKSFPKPSYSVTQTIKKVLSTKEYSWCTEIAVSPNGNTFATINEKQDQIFIFDTLTLTLSHIINKQTERDYSALAFTKNNQYLVACSRGLELWDIEKKQLKAYLPLIGEYGGRIQLFDVLYNNRVIVSYFNYLDPYDDYSAKSFLEIYNLETQTLEKSFPIDQKSYQTLSVSPDQRLFLCCDVYQNVDIYDIKTGAIIKQLRIDFFAHPNFPRSNNKKIIESNFKLNFSKDNKFIICNAPGNNHHELHIQKWDIETGNRFSFIGIGRDRDSYCPLIYSLSQFGEYIAVTRLGSNVVSIWSVADFKKINTLALKPGSSIQQLCFTGRDDRLFVKSYDQIEILDFLPEGHVKHKLSDLNENIGMQL